MPERSADTFEARIGRLDPDLFSVESQTSAKDRTALLRVQQLVRSLQPPYAYVEVGSHLGGTLVPHLLDPACRYAVSIDLRPREQPDERGRSYVYEANSTAAMIARLRGAVPPAQLRKLQTFDSDAADVPPTALAVRPQLVLIDGEHTNVAAFSDFVSIFTMIDRDAVVCFHDANLVIDALMNVERFLSYNGTEFCTVFLEDIVGVIGLRGMAGPVGAGLAGHAVDRDAFIAFARQMLARSIARNLRAGE